MEGRGTNSKTLADLLQARLGLLLIFMKSRIEDEIRNYLGSHFNCEFDV